MWRTIAATAKQNAAPTHKRRGLTMIYSFSRIDGKYYAGVYIDRELQNTAIFDSIDELFAFLESLEK